MPRPLSGFRWAKIALMLIILILDIVQANVYVDFFESRGKLLSLGAKE